MKKFRFIAGSLLAALVLCVANTGAGLASTLGWHQPKVPEQLTKN